MFYADTSTALRAQIEGCFTHRFGPRKLPKTLRKGTREIVGLVCPHAGYAYSGPVAAHAYYLLSENVRPEVVVLLAPNHTGRGSALSIMNEGVWRTPLGDVEVDTNIANEILSKSDIIDVDDKAHTLEHSVEVQLPFLQYIYGQEFKFVPICFMIQDLDTSCEVGQAVAEALFGVNALVIASTDLSHYEPQERAIQKDKMVIEAILNLSEKQLHSRVESRNISMCGHGPTIALITAAKSLGAKKAQSLCYKTSGDMTGDFSAVVGYVSVSLIK
jgi:AmmeMemoRadiSam system protein B